MPLKFSYNWLYYSDTLNWHFVFVFCMKSKTPKSHFEINWPLVVIKTGHNEWPNRMFLSMKWVITESYLALSAECPWSFNHWIVATLFWMRHANCNGRSLQKSKIRFENIGPHFLWFELRLLLLLRKTKENKTSISWRGWSY